MVIPRTETVVASTRRDPWDAPTIATELDAIGLTNAVPDASGADFMIAGSSTDLAILKRVDGVWEMDRWLDELNTSSVDSGGFLWKQRMLYFHSDRTGMYRLYRAFRPDPNSLFGDPELVFPTLEMNQTDPWLSPDGKTLVFYSQTPHGFYTATR